MTDVDLKNALLAGDQNAGDDTRDVKTYAGVVTVRALTRGEVLSFKNLRASGELDIAEYEAKMISVALVTPKMTMEEVTAWQNIDRAGGSLGDVSDAITQLSGLTQGADKSRVDSAS